MTRLANVGTPAQLPAIHNMIKSFALVPDGDGNVRLQILPIEGAVLRSKPLTLQDLLKLADDAISNARSLRV